MVRKGEIGLRQIKRDWPHHVALPAKALRGPAARPTRRGRATSMLGTAGATRRVTVAAGDRETR
jgi:hypothetical protein